MKIVGISEEAYHQLRVMQAFYSQVDGKPWTLRNVAGLAIRQRYERYLDEKQEENERRTPA